jgi:uncharacterized protein YbgA (DUF1722 family)/uncharacterized protein YbbK (DUF523 family)
MEKRRFIKPVIVSSKCIEFAACRWNGLTIKDEFVRQLMPGVDFRPICPEYEIGLGIPRDPIRVVQSKEKRILYQPASGKDFSGQMNKFARSYLESLDDVDGFILKSRSPSCGIKDVKIYGGIDKAPVTGKGAGFFGQAIIDKFSDLPVEDEGRLTNFRIREHFLTRIFALASWRNLPKSMATLVEFQASNKLLLMAYNQKELRILGRIVANHEKKRTDGVFAEYGIHFKQALATSPRVSSNINVLMHALGYFKTELKAAEKAYFLKTIDKYREGKIPLSVSAGIIHSWIARFDQKYLAGQTYFEPYPEELIQVSDSGKGRDF